MQKKNVVMLVAFSHADTLERLRPPSMLAHEFPLPFLNASCGAVSVSQWGVQSPKPVVFLSLNEKCVVAIIVAHSQPEAKELQRGTVKHFV